MQNIVFSSAYMPPLVQFVYMQKSYRDFDKLSIEVKENFIKQTYRNRTYILGANGLEALSIPVESNGGDKISIKDVRISNHGNWIHKHINAIRTAYGSSPYFEFYKDDLEQILYKKHKYLWDLNEELLYKLLYFSNMSSIDISYTDEYLEDEHYKKSYRYRLSPKIDFKDISTLDIQYYDLFGNRTIAVLGKISIIDLIFNMGPESILVINKAIEQIK